MIEVCRVGALYGDARGVSLTRLPASNSHARSFPASNPVGPELSSPTGFADSILSPSES